MSPMPRKGSPEVQRVSEYSPDSAEPSFRELDDAFLQSQTTIWLGEVLHIRFDVDIGIVDLLADGELLFQVSKVVWKMLQKKHCVLEHSNAHIYERTSSGNCDGRYMPYPKVDSFLKICQILGLTSIDLFSPSDVIEKRDIRRVCMCIRSLSKKARSKKLNVPDFDIVTYTIVMSTNLVGGICRNLELSQCKPSRSVACSPWNDSRDICGFENGAHKANITMDLTDTFLSVVQEDVATLNLSVEEGEICKDASHRRFEGKCMPSFNKETEIRLIADAEQVAATHHSCQIQKNSQEIVKRSMPDSISKNKISEQFSEIKATYDICSNYTQGNVWPSMPDLSCLVSEMLEQQISPEKENSVEDMDGIFYEDIYCVDEPCHSNQLKLHQPSAFLVSNIESKIPSRKKDCAMNVADEISPANPESCHFNDGHKGDLGPHMMKNLNLFYAMEADDAMESSEFNTCTSEMIPSFSFFRYDLCQSGRDIFETACKTFQTVDIHPIPTSGCRENRETASDDGIIVEKKVVPYISDACAKPNYSSQTILGKTLYHKEAIIPIECSKNKGREGRPVGKPGNYFLKSVAGAITIVGSLFLLFYSRQKNDKEKNNEKVVPLQIQKPNQKLFSRRKVKACKHSSLYPGEKLMF